MKSTTTGTLSGCIVWLIMFAILSTCLFPTAMFVGGFSSGSNLAMRMLGPMLCPTGTTAQTYSYDTTTTDDYGNPQPATATELHCVDSNGNVVKSDPVGFAFIWIGFLVVIGLVIAVLLAFVFAAPAGILIGRMFGKMKGKK